MHSLSRQDYRDLLTLINNNGLESIRQQLSQNTNDGLLYRVNQSFGNNASNEIGRIYNDYLEFKGGKGISRSHRGPVSPIRPIGTHRAQRAQIAPKRPIAVVPKASIPMVPKQPSRFTSARESALRRVGPTVSAVTGIAQDVTRDVATGVAQQQLARMGIPSQDIYSPRQAITALATDVISQKLPTISPTISVEEACRICEESKYQNTGQYSAQPQYLSGEQQQYGGNTAQNILSYMVKEHN
jgi:hypothetical protein